jgi:hypothetical protein
MMEHARGCRTVGSQDTDDTGGVFLRNEGEFQMVESDGLVGNTEREDAVPQHVPPELVVPFDFMRGDYVHAFPPEAVEGFRDRPVLFSPALGGFWLLTRYEDIREIFHDAETFVQSPSGTIPAIQLSRSLIPSTLNGDEHREWRRLLVPLFAPSRARMLEGRMREFARAAAEKLLPAGRADVVERFARDLPVFRFCAQFGFQREEGDHLLHLGNELIYGSERVIMEQGIQAGQAYRQEVTARVDYLMSEVLKRRRREPGDDVLTELTQLRRRGGETLDDEDILNVMSLFFFAGSDSSTAAIAFALLHLATHPGDRAGFISNPADRDGYIEELLRLGAVHYISRRVSKDVEFHGVQFKAGDMVALPTLAANRDPLKFDHADQIDLQRSAPANITFGVGRHRCIGLHYARMELRLAMEEFHAVIPAYELDETVPLEYITGVRSRPLRLPLVFRGPAS